MSGLFYVWLKLEHECHKENWRNHNNNNKNGKNVLWYAKCVPDMSNFCFVFLWTHICFFFYEKEITFLNGFLTFFTYTQVLN